MPDLMGTLVFFKNFSTNVRERHPLWRSWGTLLWHKMSINFASSVPHFFSPALYSSWEDHQNARNALKDPGPQKQHLASQPVSGLPLRATPAAAPAFTLASALALAASTLVLSSLFPWEGQASFTTYKHKFRYQNSKRLLNSCSLTVFETLFLSSFLSLLFFFS